MFKENKCGNLYPDCFMSKRLKFKFIEDSNLVEICDEKGLLKVISIYESEDFLSLCMQSSSNKTLKQNVISFHKS